MKPTQSRIAELALPQMTLPVWYDVDDGAALERLIADLPGITLRPDRAWRILPLIPDVS